MRISNRQIHLFNPGHETAIESGLPNYTPDATVRQMMNDLSLLPLWYGNPGDSEWTDNEEAAIKFLKSLPHELLPSLQIVSSQSLSKLKNETLKAAPWGISPHSIRFFERLQKQGASLSIPAWDERLGSLTHRRTAAQCLHKVLQCCDTPTVAIPQYCTDQDELRNYMACHQPPFILKAPFSCSGRGIYRIESSTFDETASRWTAGIIKRQGSVSIEPLLNKIRDFAMEFYSDGQGHISYKGLSVFNTLSKGAFSGGLLDTPEKLQKVLTAFVPAKQLQAVQTAVESVLQELLSNIYQGYLGIDMLIFEQNGSYAIHPFIEMNLRYTMGLVALQLSRNLLHPDSHGDFIISYEKKGEAHKSHLAYQEKHPLQLKDGKIQSGYFALTPVTAESNYRAFILISV